MRTLPSLSSGRACFKELDTSSFTIRPQGIERRKTITTKQQKIHSSVKEALGYDKDISDKDFLKSWKDRSTQVCKPCWELKYCPYGPFVEQSPLLPSSRQNAIEHNEYLKRVLETDQLGDATPIDEELRTEYSELLAQAKKDPRVLLNKVMRDDFMEYVIERAQIENKDLSEYLQPPLSSFETYKVPYPLNQDIEAVDEELPIELLKSIDAKIERIEAVLRTGIDDRRVPLDPVRRNCFEREVREFNLDDYPEAIPQVVLDLECSIFGHICPVVFVGESITETTENRRRGRYIPFHIKMRVVRRDNYTCQRCGKHLQDDEVEFDHIIPHAKGGSCEEHNIRLTCYDCNRNKSDDIEL
jgi:5-methylcytosine-specific restriction endonuclease McrA